VCREAPEHLIVPTDSKSPMDFLNRKKSEEPEELRARSFLIMSKQKSYTVTASNVEERNNWMVDIGRMAR
jgi:hypothetical protein